MSNKKIIPRLRFPEFESDGEWKKKLLGDVASFSKGKGISKSDISVKGTISCIRYGQLYTTYNETITDVISKTNLPIDNLIFSEKNDVIIPSSGETQEDIATASCVINSGIALGGDINIIRSDINGVFLSYYLNNAKKQDIAKLAQGISVVHLYSSQLEKLEIEVPKPKEQQKIANCLSSLDNLIGAANVKLEVLKAHKKGLLQQLFPAEGETVPKLRFPEFENDGEWKIVKLQAIATIKRGAASQYLNYVERATPNAIRLLRINDFLSNQASYVENTSDMKRFRVQTGDILIAGTGATAGITFMIPPSFNDLAYSYNAPRIRVFESNKYFIYQQLKSSFILEQQKKLFVGNAQPFLDTKAISNFLISIPKKFREQQKIADCLSAVDDLVETQSKKIDFLKEHKKGLMQQLFPIIND